MRSEALWPNEGVGEIGKQEQGHSAAENVVDSHLPILPVKDCRRLWCKPATGPGTKCLVREQQCPSKKISFSITVPCMQRAHECHGKNLNSCSLKKRSKAMRWSQHACVNQQTRKNVNDSNQLMLCASLPISLIARTMTQSGI
jgi:hypothetical protein